MNTAAMSRRRHSSSMGLGSVCSSSTDIEPACSITAVNSLRQSPAASGLTEYIRALAIIRYLTGGLPRGLRELSL